MKQLLFLFFLFVMTDTFAQRTSYENDPEKNTTATYPEVISFYQSLEKQYKHIKMFTCGMTDAGKPLHLIVLSADKFFDPESARKNNKTILFINNGIHPGEPEGIDASMMLLRNMLEKGNLPKNLVVCLIPVYNIDGQLNRGVSRINQNGPNSYGFRGNYKNLDLNRDFIKTESQNSASFQEIFNRWKPEIFVDNHTSNGADYQYVMTLIPTQKDKLNPVLSSYLTGSMLPFLYDKMKKSGFEMTPYVNSVEETPDAGITGFLETPRYTTGYAALHNTIGFMPETHMLKSYKQRVESTYALMEHFIELVDRDAAKIRENKMKADEITSRQKEFALDWKLDTGKHTTFSFKGYVAKYKPSEISGLQRLYYDRNVPFEKNIKVWDDYQPSVSVQKPIAYIIPQSWQRVVELLKLNNVKLERLAENSSLPVDSYYITDYKTAPRPFEGHYLHSGVKVRAETQSLNFLAGDYIVYTDQAENRYIVETLEPQGVDSFFAWNFFDSILGQKEHFSPYVFEDEAAKILRENPDLRKQLEEEKKADKQLASNADAQLDWVYKHSVYYEKTHMRYPVGRLMTPIKLNTK